MNPHIRRVTDQFAKAGFTAMAPALFDPVQPDVELGYDDTGVSRGRDYAASLGFERALQIVVGLRALAARVGASRRRGRFLLGRHRGDARQHRQGLPSVTYYGGRSVPFLGEPALAPMLFHFGENDPADSAERRAEASPHHPDATVHSYPAGHGFNCDERHDYARRIRRWHGSAPPFF